MNDSTVCCQNRRNALPAGALLNNRVGMFEKTEKSVKSVDITGFLFILVLTSDLHFGNCGILFLHRPRQRCAYRITDETCSRLRGA